MRCTRPCGPGKCVILGLMLRGLPLLVTLFWAAIAPAETVQVITADDWARPRSGESLVQMPALKRTVRAYLDANAERGRRIVIRHPRGEEGVLWAEELRGWLVALGIPSQAVDVSPASTRVDALELAVTDMEN
ncbi:MAG: hypothetical protein GWN46_18070 [Gammaproteobacteria bacterium]|nr:hypothetical protein [Gammaproteobacteria bacterium]NIT93733.1 hypothetical protein [Gammaproteobacteria bacterium]NIV48569.1 hypothetical protein [Gammaproteobacteria bacterium]